jgi:hypothetical protein
MNSNKSLFNPSPAMRMAITLQNEIAAEWNALTYARNNDVSAGYEETVIHIILTTNKGGTVNNWKCANGKFVSSVQLDRMVKDGLLAKRNGKRNGKRNAYSSPVYTRIF